MSELASLFTLSLVAGFIGTFVMTISQEIDLRFINKRPISFSPALVLFKILRFDFEKLAPRTKVFASYIVHFGWGTVWGFPLALLYFFGYTGMVQVGAVYFPIILLQGWIILWLFKISGPPWTWEYKAVIYEIIHKMIYTVSATVSFMLLLD